MNAEDWEQERWAPDEPELLTVEPPSPKSLWERVCQFIVDVGCESVARRQCPACGASCLLSEGRHSKRWFWTHERLSDCEFDRTGTRIMFPTREAAMTEERIFKAR